MNERERERERDLFDKQISYRTKAVQSTVIHRVEHVDSHVPPATSHLCKVISVECIYLPGKLLEIYKPVL